MSSLENWVDFDQFWKWFFFSPLHPSYSSSSSHLIFFFFLGNEIFMVSKCTKFIQTNITMHLYALTCSRNFASMEIRESLRFEQCFFSFARLVILSSVAHPSSIFFFWLWITGEIVEMLSAQDFFFFFFSSYFYGGKCIVKFLNKSCYGHSNGFGVYIFHE